MIFSQEVLLALIKKGITREESYALVHKNAMKSWEEKVKTIKKNFGDFTELDKFVENLEKSYNQFEPFRRF